MIRFYIFVVLEITNNVQKAGKSTFVFVGSCCRNKVDKSSNVQSCGTSDGN